jgi:polar amino acid transport system substrate-binding protein
LPEVGKEMGVTFKFRFLPWPRCELAAQNLEAWATMPYVPTPERDAKFLFSQPLYAKKTLLFYYQQDERQYPQTFTDLSELQPYKMGGVRGYYYEALFADAGLSLDLATSEESSFKKLRAGRVDMVAAVDGVGWDVIRKNFSADEQRGFHTLETPLAVGHNFLMTSRNYPQTEQLLERFNQALAKLRRNGVYKEIAERHGVTVDN